MITIKQLRNSLVVILWYWWNLGTDHLTFRGEGGSKKNILIPNVAEKSILILVEDKKYSDSEFLSYNLMLNSRKKKYSNSRVRKNNFERKKKTYPPPCKLNGRSLMSTSLNSYWERNITPKMTDFCYLFFKDIWHIENKKDQMTIIQWCISHSYITLY